MAENVIEVRNLEFAWQRKLGNVLSISIFDLARGERCFLRGPSGTGKTTLLSLLGGVVVPDAGTVTINGTELGKMSGPKRDRFRADQIGYIFQMFNLIPYLSPVQNVLLPCRFSAVRKQRIGGPPDVEAARLLTQLGLDQSLINRRTAAALSVGQQQRVAAARALIGNPALVIADEPTSSLDSDARSAFIELLFDECRRNGTSVLFVSHDQSLASHFDRSVDLAEINRVQSS
jgi:putative ABC transport system ATP-binding protein